MYQDLVGTIWHHKTIVPGDHLQLCYYDALNQCWYHDQTVNEGIFLLLGFEPNPMGKEHDYLRFAVTVASSIGVRACWFAPSETWKRL